MTSKPFISVQGLARRFPEPTGKGELTVFDDVWFDVPEGEFVCMIGHSGCGKSTILNILAGLDQPSDGHIIVGGKHISGPSLDRAVIFQGHALMPWMSALANIELAVSSRHRDWSQSQVRAHAEKYLELVHLTPAMHKKPAQLSGGMRQRVGIARALAIEPKVLLMDEPFSALDALTRGSLQDEVLSIHGRTRQTTFMITHDIDEAMLLADKILLMTNGPKARIAEIVENTLPRERNRTNMHKLANYYPVRNHLVDFLVTRSREMAGGAGPPFDPKSPPVIRPTARAQIHALEATSAEPAQATGSAASPLRLVPPTIRAQSRRIDPAQAAAGGRALANAGSPARNRPLETSKPKWR
jgi:nitrate/nitrite transport system ATP-binding protein